jgi:hypothetical protein
VIAERRGMDLTPCTLGLWLTMTRRAAVPVLIGARPAVGRLTGPIVAWKLWASLAWMGSNPEGKCEAVPLCLNFSCIQRKVLK